MTQKQLDALENRVACCLACSFVPEKCQCASYVTPKEVLTIIRHYQKLLKNNEKKKI